MAMAPAKSSATAVKRTMEGSVIAPATPATKARVETSPSFAPKIISLTPPPPLISQASIPNTSVFIRSRCILSSEASLRQVSEVAVSLIFSALIARSWMASSSPTTAHSKNPFVPRMFIINPTLRSLRYAFIAPSGSLPNSAILSDQNLACSSSSSLMRIRSCLILSSPARSASLRYPLICTSLC